MSKLRKPFIIRKTIGVDPDNDSVVHAHISINLDGLNGLLMGPQSLWYEIRQLVEQELYWKKKVSDSTGTEDSNRGED